jgi:C-terminal binding protein
VQESGTSVDQNQKRPIVLIVDRVDQPYTEDCELEGRELLGIADVRYVRVSTLSEAVNSANASQCDAIVAWHGVTLDRSGIEALTRCKLVVRPAVGYDDIELPLLRERGIKLCCTPSYGTEEVADHTLALLLASARSLWTIETAARAGAWHWCHESENVRLRGKTLGIVGLGRIGSTVAVRARAFGMHVCFYDPFRESGAEKVLGLERVDSLHSLLPRADFLTLHCALTSKNRHMLDAPEFALLKPAAVLLNTARGALMNTSALKFALDQNLLRMACLDVLEDEPAVDAAISSHPRVHLTMHSAFYSPDAARERRLLALRRLREFLTNVEIVDSVV